MKTITTRYGASVALTISIADPLATDATLFIGEEREAPIITKTAAVTDEVADLSLLPEDTEIPLGTYRYQINVAFSDGRLEKFPSADDCGEDGLPKFIVVEALDEQEVS